MKNLTVSVDEHIYTQARVVAAKRGTSVSRLVRDFLSGIGGQDTPAAGEWQALWQEIDAENAAVGEQHGRARTHADARIP